MGEKTGIAWTDHTFNPWIGCHKVSAGCQNCYAERQNNDRFHWVKEWGKDYRRTSEANWKKPIQWARQAVKDGVVRRVFCASLADVFDPNVPQEWREDLWDLIDQSSDLESMDVLGIGLEWLILTKRPENIQKMARDWWLAGPPSYVRMGITCENDEMARLRMPIFFDAWKGNNFISWEPAIGSLQSVETYMHKKRCSACGQWWQDDPVYCTNCSGHGVTMDNLPTIHWLICGAESGTAARPMNIEWARSVRDQCVAAGIPFFLKQMVVDGKLVHMPELDGKVWDQFPEDD